MGMPPVGVRPMVVSIDTPLRRAQRLAPLPRCAKMARSGRLLAEVMHQRLVGEAMETIASNTCVEVALGKRQVRSDFRHGAMKGIVEAGKMAADGKIYCAEAMSDRACGICRGAKCVAARRSSRTCGVMSWWVRSFGPSMHNAMADGDWSDMNVFPDCCSESGKGITLRLEDTFPLHKRISVGRPNLQRAVACPMPSALPVSSGSSSLSAPLAVIHAELQRRRTAVQYEDQIIFSARGFSMPSPAISSCESLPYRCPRRERS